jgi:translation initiation factor IF-3
MNKKAPNNFVPSNYRIKQRVVQCINSDGENLGDMSRDDAIRLAKSEGLDLVMISSGNENVPICKILDYGKYKYDQSKKQKELSKKQRESEIKIKELKFRPSTAENDLRIKAGKVKDILEDGDRVKVTIAFRGREMSHTNIGYDTLNSFIDMISEIYPAVELINKPTMQGRFLTTLIGKKK